MRLQLTAHNEIKCKLHRIEKAFKSECKTPINHMTMQKKAGDLTAGLPDYQSHHTTGPTEKIKALYNVPAPSCFAVALVSISGIF